MKWAHIGCTQSLTNNKVTLSYDELMKASLILDDKQSQVTCESTQRTEQSLQTQQNSIDSQEMSQLTIDSFDECGSSEPILLSILVYFSVHVYHVCQC